MANEIIQLVNPNNDNNQFPQTVASAVTLQNGNTVEQMNTMLNNNIAATQKNAADILTIASTQVPESTVEAAITNYIDSHGDVLATKADIDAINENLSTLVTKDICDLTWEVGSFDLSGQPASYNNRARINDYYAVDASFKINIPKVSGFAFAIQQYNANKTFVSAVGWLDESPYYYTPSANVSYVRFGAKPVTDKTITSSDLTTLNNCGICKITSIASSLESLSDDVDALESVVTTKADKSYVDTADTQINTKLNRTTRSLDYLWKKSKGIIYDTEEVTSASSEVTVPSGAMEYASLDKLGGMSRKGKNLLNPILETTTKNGITLTKNSDLTYTLNGTSIGSWNTLFSDTIGVGSYKILGSPSGGSGSNGYRLRIAKNGSFLNEDIGNGATFTLTESATITVQIVIDSGVVVNNLLFKPMITTDTSATYSSYEPYTTSLIDAKVDKVVSVGKNRIDKNNVTSGYLYNSSGELVADSDSWKLTDFINVENKTFTILQTMTTQGEGLRYALFDKNKKFIQRYFFANAESKTVSEHGACYVRAFLNINNYNIDTWCLNLSDSTEFAPYKKTEKPIPTALIAKCPDYGIGINANCYNYIDFAEKKYHHKVKPYTINADLTCVKSSSTDFDRYILLSTIPLTEIGSSGTLLQNMLHKKYVFGTSAIGQMYGDNYGGNYARLIFQFSEYGTSTIDDFKNDVKNTVLYYELATEEIIDLSDVWEILQVEPNGTIQFHYPQLDNGYDVDVPSVVDYMVEVSGV